jgi:hypothetical protein
MTPEELKTLATKAELGAFRGETFKSLHDWQERAYSLQFTYLNQETGPDFKLIFVDEMESDPDVIAMRATLAKAKGEAGPN